MLKIKEFHPQYLTNEKGGKTAVVISIEKFKEIIEDIEDLACVAERRDEPTMTHEELITELKRDGLI
jgi:hypothetical protein